MSASRHRTGFRTAAGLGLSPRARTGALRHASPGDRLPGVPPRSDDHASVVTRMRRFRCYFLDERGAAAAWRAVEHDSDEFAREHALGMLLGYPGATVVEVWESAALIYRYSRLEAPQTPKELRRLSRLAIAAAERETDGRLKQAIVCGVASLVAQAAVLERRAIEQCQSDPRTEADPRERTS